MRLPGQNPEKRERRMRSKERMKELESMLPFTNRSGLARRGVLLELAGCLRDDETILHVISGDNAVGEGAAAMCATEDRIVVISGKLAECAKTSLRYDEISGVESGFDGGLFLILHAGVRRLGVKGSFHKEEKVTAFLDFIEQRRTVDAPQAPSNTTNPQIAALKEAAELHQSGVLSDDEFAALKKKILDGS